VHGGATRKTIVANARRTLEADVRSLLPPREKWPKVESSLDELFDLARESRAFREALAERVAQLDNAGIRDDFDRETVRATVQVYVQAIEQSARINASIARLQVDERRLGGKWRTWPGVQGSKTIPRWFPAGTWFGLMNRTASR
jgi:hypothetical protein